MHRLFLSLALLIVFIAPSLAEDLNRTQIEQIIADYIKNNPRAIIDSVNSYGEQQQALSAKDASERIKARSAWLYNNKNHAQAGNSKGDVTIVEFFDYNCGYCKQAMPELMALLDIDKNVRLIFVEIPILGESSKEAAKWALAAKDQDAYLEFHVALMKHHGPLSSGVIEDYAKKAGIDVEKAKKQKDLPEIQAAINDNLKVANELGVSGTPAFVVGDQLLGGWVGAESLRDAIKAARESKK